MMKKPRLKVFCSLLIFYLFLCSSLYAQAKSISLQPIVSNLSYPVYAAAAHDGSNRLFIAEQTGKIKIFNDNILLANPFLDISGEVKICYECGLLSIAFHRKFSRNRRFFVSFVNQDGNLVVREYKADAIDGSQTDPGSGTDILIIEHSDSEFHYGGQLQFGPDGYLYISTGDGGLQGDPNNHSQDLNSLLGKILRINVDDGNPYTIPKDNPFNKRANVRKEIYAYGLRNPWRFTFDQKTGDFFAGDVGSSYFEEINLVTAGANYGWPKVEGKECMRARNRCDQSDLAAPIAFYSHEKGVAVIGGYYYRGEKIKALNKRYIFADFASGRIWALKELGSRWSKREILQGTFYISSFAEGEDRELYALDLRGILFKIQGE